MNKAQKFFSKLGSAFLTAVVFIMCLSVKSNAAFSEITVNNNEPAAVSVYIGDTGVIRPNIVIPVDEDEKYEQDNGINKKFINYSDDTTEAVTTENTNESLDNEQAEKEKQSEDIPKNYIYYFESYDTGILTVDNNGNYTALSRGNVNVSVKVYLPDEYYNRLVFSTTILFTVNIDMTNVTLSTYNVNAVMYPVYSYLSKPYYDEPSAAITINSPIVFDDLDETTFSYVCSNPVLGIDASVSENVIYIYQSSNTQSSAVITFYIYGKEFAVNYQSVRVGISDQSLLLPKNSKKQLTVSGYPDEIIWSSDDPNIATVDANGVVTGKKIGNVIIKAKVGDRYLGCAVSVTTSKLKKVAERANYIGIHWKYSQEKRTKKGYYDCSSLVWKAYKEKARVTFGSPGYPGVALSEAKWCKAKGRMLKGGMTYKKVSHMKLNPGDLLFKSTDMKKKYKDIYHVEMFTGYFCHYVEADGTACFSPIWAARGTFYSWEEGSLLGRPMKQ